MNQKVDIVFTENLRSIDQRNFGAHVSNGIEQCLDDSAPRTSLCHSVSEKGHFRRPLENALNCFDESAAQIWKSYETLLAFATSRVSRFVRH
jgi:hypothetical protein